MASFSGVTYSEIMLLPCACMKIVPLRSFMVEVSLMLRRGADEGVAE